jgi:hypothetical protein
MTIKGTVIEKQRLKPMLLTLFLATSLAACSVGNSTPAASGPGSAALGSSASLGRSASPIRPERSQAFVKVRTARSFAILAGSTVTNTGPSQITGNVGIFPGNAITGFPPGVIHGDLHAGDTIAQQAKLDLTRAYNDAMGRLLGAVKVAGNIGGQTLAPGLYKSTSSLAISSGDLTLDGRGNSDAVFIFQIASKFTTTTGRMVILTNGAHARNVFWAVGSSATLGTGCSFYGNLLVHQSISMATGTVMVGRALTQVGAVTMQRNTIVKPAR